MMPMQGMLDGFDAPAARSAEIARVIVDVDLTHMDRPLDYVVPDALVDQAQVGSLVRVRFSGSRVDGWIVERIRREVDDHVGRVESVVSATPVLTPALYEASRRIASRFLATTSQVFPPALPPRHARRKRGIGIEAPRVAHDHRQVVGGGVACLPRWGGVPVPSARRGISTRHRHGAAPLSARVPVGRRGRDRGLRTRRHRHDAHR